MHNIFKTNYITVYNKFHVLYNALYNVLYCIVLQYSNKFHSKKPIASKYPLLEIIANNLE